MVALAATLTLASCKKDNGGQGGDDPTVKKIARVTRVGDYHFTYNQDGTVKDVTEIWGDQPTDRETHTFYYNGKNITIKVGDVAKYEVTVNDKGLATTVKNCAKDETYTYTFDKDNFCIDAKCNGVDVCQQAVNDLCVDYWTRASKKEDGSLDHWRHKDHTYLSKDNLGDIHPEWAEDFGQKRWFYETGLLGRGSAKLMSTAQWDDAEKLAKYEYEYDSKGLVTKETKYYGLEGKMDLDTETVFEWQMLN